MTDQRGSISLPIIIAATLGLGLVASVYLNYVQHQSAQQDRKLLQGEITDLRYQVRQDQQAAAGIPSTSPTPTPLATPETTPTPTPAVAGTGSVSISQLGIKFTVAEPVADLTYDWVPSGTYHVAALSTRALLSKYPACKPSTINNALGFIVQKKAVPGVSSTGVLIRQAGIYNYYYIKPTSFCAPDQAGKDTLAAARAAIKNVTLPTLTN